MIKNLYSGQDNIKDHFYSIILFSITNFPFTFQSCDNQLIFDPKMCTFWLVIFSLKIKHEYIIASGLSGLANLEIDHQVPHFIRIYTFSTTPHSLINGQAKMNGLFCLLLFVSTSSTFARQYRGTCRDNTLIDVFNTDLLDQCKDNCRDDDNCVALTFNLELKVCQTFSFCNRFVNGRCPTCITVFKEEFVPEICNFQGICQVRFCLNCEQHELAACLLTFLTFRDDGYKR